MELLPGMEKMAKVKGDTLWVGGAQIQSKDRDKRTVIALLDVMFEDMRTAAVAAIERSDWSEVTNA